MSRELYLVRRRWYGRAGRGDLRAEPGGPEPTCTEYVSVGHMWVEYRRYARPMSAAEAVACQAAQTTFNNVVVDVVPA